MPQFLDLQYNLCAQLLTKLTFLNFVPHNDFFQEICRIPPKVLNHVLNTQQPAIYCLCHQKLVLNSQNYFFFFLIFFFVFLFTKLTNFDKFVFLFTPIHFRSFFIVKFFFKHYKHHLYQFLD